MLMLHMPRGLKRTLGATLVVAAGLSAAAAPVAKHPPAQPKVEFVKVDGWPCLQPRMEETVTTLGEFRAAELRWLANNYPGASTPRWQTEIVLGPVSNPFDKPEPVTIRCETAEVQPTEGANVSICFDIGLQERKP
jgi:hypothetical protein